MEGTPNWRPIGPDEPPGGAPPEKSSATDDGRQDPLKLILGGLLGVAVIAAAGLVLWASTPQPQVVLGPGGEMAFGPDAAAPSLPAETSAGSGVEELIVDVQGAVLRPGPQRLPAGSRVGDAISAAGGYSPQLDIRAAAEQLNLAERLADGAKVRVPARGDPTPQPAQPPPGAGSDGGSSPAGGLIDVNTASQAQLETLPGIGPVTAGKIITAREEAPFVTVDDLLARKVVGPATFEKIRPLITVTP
jgi:competence protein ComEA